MIRGNWIAFGIVGFVIALTYFSAVGEVGGLGSEYAEFANLSPGASAASSSEIDSSAVISANAASISALTETEVAPADSPPSGNNQNEINLPYPIQDRGNDFLNSNPNQNSFDLQDPPAIQKSVEYNGSNQQYILQQKIGNQDYRQPSSISFQDFLNQQYGQLDNQYWYDRSNASTLLDRKGLIPEVNVNNRLFDRIFGGSQVNIRPQGNVDLTFGGNYQNVLNPTLTKRQRQQGGFTFDMNIDMNVVGQIGDKLKLSTNYNTQSTFNFENQVKLDYTGYQDEIIKKIEAGNISLPLHGSLITGSQSLFGLKLQLQFGRLTVTSVISQQQAQQQNITVQGGAQTQTFNITADNYDENRNFFLAQYFKNNFNHAMSTIPIVSSEVTITRMEVWVTNKTGATTNVRDIVAFADLGESQPYDAKFNNGGRNVLPYANNLNRSLNSNSLYPTLIDDPKARLLNSVLTEITTANPNLQLQSVQDFEKTYARQLASTEYTFDPRLGTLYLNQQLDPDDVLAVAYQYTYNGQTYQVGEFASDVPSNVDSSKVLFLKMLKATSARTKLPIWNLMMKNVYSLGAYQVNPQDFFLDVYYLAPGGGERRYIPADSLNGIPLIQLLGLDRLNNNQDPQPDGVFDFLDGLTIISSSGKIIFPVLQPFGRDLAKKFSNTAEAAPYVYLQLYDSTKTIAQQFPQFNRYLIKGTYKSSVSSDISLGAFNIPQGSVTVTAGGQKLVENVDYTVDYNLGRVKILNQGLLNSGIPINVGFENNTQFSILTKTLFGTRLDYYVNKHLSFGGTLLKEWERPYTNKLNVGDDPISNTIFGADGTYQSQSGFLTRLVNAIPGLNTKEPSSITVTGEAARLIPGHSKAIGKDGTVYIDDFEGTQTTYDLRFPFISWHLASTPQGNGLFPNAENYDDWSYGFHRAKLSWYNIDPFFWGSFAPDGIRTNKEEVNGFYTRPVRTTEIFPTKDVTAYAIGNENTFDLHYEPRIRGPYNFDTVGLTVDSGQIKLPDSTANWAGIQRSLDETDFEQANIEYIQFWVLDPYLNDRDENHHGDLYVDLGNISEDLLRDGKFEYENGLSVDGSTANEDSSVWGYAPKSPPITNSFDNDPNSRKFQDVGYDGVSDISEGSFFGRYMNALANRYGTSSPIYQDAAKDPCDDDYKYYDDPAYGNNAGIIDRYSQYNNPEGNSPISDNTQQVSFAATNTPETEDLNRDNTVNENEQYFEYVVHFNPEALSAVGQNFITDRVDVPVPAVNGYSPGTETWYQIKIPIEEYLKRVGEIPDFKSIRFIRAYLTGFDTTVTLRFARFELVRNQWRKYLYSLQQPGEYTGGDNNGVTSFNVTSVGLEENSQRQPVPYTLPPGIQREQLVGQVGTLAYQNEQSLSLQIHNLQNGDSRAVYKNINLDLRTYKYLQLFTHCEAVDDPNSLKDGDLTAFIRLGSDFTDNYYEYELPLQVTPWTPPFSQTDIWPLANTFDIALSDLVAAKEARNLAGVPLNTPYTVIEPNGAKITIVGNPDLGIVVTAMLGVRNPKTGNDDDGKSKSAEVWFDEFRVSGFDEQGGNAAITHADIKLADFGTVALSAAAHTIGFGQLEQQLQDRYKDDDLQYNIATNLQLGKFFGKKAGILIPFYAGISKDISNPQYDPYDLDILLKNKLDFITDPTQRKEAHKAAQTYSSIGSINFTNVRKVSTNRNAKLHFFSPENLNFTFAYTRTYSRTPLILSDLLKQYHGELGYQFAGKDKYISPFANLIPAKSKYLRLIRDFNINILPTNLSFSTAIDRRMGQTILRPFDTSELVIPTYDKYFTWSRLEGFKLNLSRGLNIDFNANALARIDEPDGFIDTKEKKDSVWKNILNFGRITIYTHTANVTWTVPINKIPIFDWIQATARYGTNYGWLTAPLVLDSATNKIVISTLGNTINNNQNIALNGTANLRNLYNKWKFLKKYDTQNNLVGSPVRQQGKSPPNAKNDSTSVASKQKNKNAVGPEAFFIRLPLMVKKISLDYTESHATTLPGFLPKPQWIGQNFDQNAPGFRIPLWVSARQ